MTIRDKTRLTKDLLLGDPY